jgi:hypothetical protein
MPDPCRRSSCEEPCRAVSARFCFVQERDKNLGGNSIFRSAERITTEKRHLKRKWKAHIDFGDYKSQERVAMSASRRQSVAL